MGNLLIVGARIGSLGHYIGEVAAKNGWDVTTAGVSGDENISLDITSHAAVHALLTTDEDAPSWHSVVCTAGVNYEGGITDDSIRGKLDQSLAVNAVGPLLLLHCWADWWSYMLDETYLGTDHNNVVPTVPMHFVAVSSNSAHIARSQSLSYCASKAALSMGLRCAARELAGTWLNVWGVEPGWLSGTPMSKEVNARIGYGLPRHRIPGDRTVDPAALAHFIVGGLRNPYSSLNGCMIRMDGGEQ
jgi:NAD(P)-dependent dehydrogenase (short-subunit alcohol dehydrogenase family)